MTESQAGKSLFDEALDLGESNEVHLTVREVNGKIMGTFTAVTPIDPTVLTPIEGGIGRAVHENKLFTWTSFSHEDLIAMRQLLNQYFHNW